MPPDGLPLFVWGLVLSHATFGLAYTNLYKHLTESQWAKRALKFVSFPVGNARKPAPIRFQESDLANASFKWIRLKLHHGKRRCSSLFHLPGFHGYRFFTHTQVESCLAHGSPLPYTLQRDARSTPPPPTHPLREVKIRSRWLQSEAWDTQRPLIGSPSLCGAQKARRQFGEALSLCQRGA